MTLPRPPYDPELSAALATMVSPQSFEIGDIPRIRQESRQFDIPVEELLLGREVTHEVLRAPRKLGPELTLSVFRPSVATTPGPGLYFMHGGGMAFGHRLSDAELFADWVERFGLTVVTVEYRLAPEHPDPAPSEDCYAGLLWTAEHAAELGIDIRQLLVGGVSAGGGLAAAMALMARDRNGPALIGQLLICPMLDDRDATVSAAQYETGPWNRESNRVAWSALLAGERDDTVSPYAAPARAVDLTGLPPAFIEAGSAEVFRDEDVAYASRLWAAGGQADLHVWAGGFHCFWQVGHAAVSQAATDTRNAWLARLLGVSNDVGSNSSGAARRLAAQRGAPA